MFSIFKTREKLEIVELTISETSAAPIHKNYPDEPSKASEIGEIPAADKKPTSWRLTSESEKFKELAKIVLEKSKINNKTPINKHLLHPEKTKKLEFYGIPKGGNGFAGYIISIKFNNEKVIDVGDDSPYQLKDSLFQKLIKLTIDEGESW